MQRMRIRTGPHGLTAEMEDLPRRSSPAKDCKEAIGFTVGTFAGFGAIYESGRLLAVVESEGEAEHVLRDGAKWQDQQQKKRRLPTRGRRRCA